MKRGIDISRHQGELDFDYIAANFDFVIIRCGYGSDLSADDSECSQCDSMAQTYIDECEKRGIPYGLYIYQYASNNDESLSEAAHIREWYNKCNPTMGVYLDIEDADGYKAAHNIDYHDTQEFALTWLDALSDVTAKGIYASHSWLNDYMNVDELIEHGALIWEAHWNDDGEICEDKFAMSQESSDYYLNDGTRVDYDIMYDEVYDRLIKANEYDHRNDDVEDNDNVDEDNNALTVYTGKLGVGFKPVYKYNHPTTFNELTLSDVKDIIKNGSDETTKVTEDDTSSKSSSDSKKKS